MTVPVRGWVTQGIYPAVDLKRLAQGLAKTAERYGRPIWVISDEAYSRILFDNRRFTSPSLFHPYSLLARTYNKSALALAPDLPEAELLRKVLSGILCSCGLTMPDAVMQYALPDIDSLMIDLTAM